MFQIRPDLSLTIFDKVDRSRLFFLSIGFNHSTSDWIESLLNPEHLFVDGLSIWERLDLFSQDPTLSLDTQKEFKIHLDLLIEAGQLLKSALIEHLHAQQQQNHVLKAYDQDL